MILSNSKHELFAQLVAKGLSPSTAYVKAGYARASAQSNATRMMGNEGIRTRILELKTAVAQHVVLSEIRRRSWRVNQLQSLVDDMLSLRSQRKILYGGQLGESSVRYVRTPEDEELAVAEGFAVDPEWSDAQPLATRIGELEDQVGYMLTADGPPVHSKEKAKPAAPPEYPKRMTHPGHPNGGSTGLLVKDYRGKNAEQEIWKFDASLVARLCGTLKQAAIEEGQWSEKRQAEGDASIHVLMEELAKGRQRVAEAKLALDAENAAKLLQ